MKIDGNKSVVPMYSTRCRVFDAEKSGLFYAYGVPFVAHNDEEASRIFHNQLGALRTMAARSAVPPFDRCIQLCRVGSFRVILSDPDKSPLFECFENPELIDSDSSFEKGDPENVDEKGSDTEQLRI